MRERDDMQRDWTEEKKIAAGIAGQGMSSPAGAEHTKRLLQSSNRMQPAVPQDQVLFDTEP